LLLVYLDVLRVIVRGFVGCMGRVADVLVDVWRGLLQSFNGILFGVDRTAETTLVAGELGSRVFCLQFWLLLVGGCHVVVRSTWNFDVDRAPIILDCMSAFSHWHACTHPLVVALVRIDQTGVGPVTAPSVDLLHRTLSDARFSARVDELVNEMDVVSFL
jgi:hypothetical protein